MKGQLNGMMRQGTETAWEKEMNPRNVIVKNPSRPVWAGGWHAPLFHPHPLPVVKTCRHLGVG